MGRHYWQSFGSIATFLGLFLSVFLLLSCASAKAENKTDPTANLNLNPIQAWRSSEYCLENTSSSCWQKYTLTHSGWLNVSHADGPLFCAEGGCAAHTKWVLLCLNHVKKDYKFENGASVDDLYETINLGCDSPQGFNGTSLYSSAGYSLYSASTAFMIAAIALVLNAALF